MFSLRLFNFVVGFFLTLIVMSAGNNFTPEKTSDDLVLQSVILPPNSPEVSVKVCQNEHQFLVTPMGQSLPETGFPHCQWIDVLPNMQSVENVGIEDPPRPLTIQEI